MFSDEDILRYHLLDYSVLDLKEVSYDVFKVKNRIIYNPSEKLKRAQRYIKTYVNYAFPLNSTTLKCAKIHSGKKWILKMDIKDFYESVRFEDIQKVMGIVFHPHPNIFIQYLVDLVTIGNKLPTGAPSSAHIANACFLPLDKRIKEYCDRHEVLYSRYMDDLTFSCDNKNVLVSVEYFVEDIVQCLGFSVNRKKTRYVSANKQQSVLGLVVNKEVRVPKKLRRRIRSMLHHSAMFQGRICPRDEKYASFENSGELSGYLNYIKSVDLKTYGKLMDYKNKL